MQENGKIDLPTVALNGFSTSVSILFSDAAPATLGCEQFSSMDVRASPGPSESRIRSRRQGLLS